MSETSRPYHHGDLANVLVDVATALVTESGIEHLSMREVARRAGVSPGAPFRHFPTRDALLAAVADRAMQRLVEAVETSLTSTDLDPLAGLEAIGAAYLQWIRENPTHFAIVSQRRLVALEGNALRNNDALRERMRALLVAARSGGQMRQDAEVETVLLSCRALVYGLGRMYIDGHFPEWVPEGDPFQRMQGSLKDFIQSLRSNNKLD